MGYTWTMADTPRVKRTAVAWWDVTSVVIDDVGGPALLYRLSDDKRPRGATLADGSILEAFTSVRAVTEKGRIPLWEYAPEAIAAVETAQKSDFFGPEAHAVLGRIEHELTELVEFVRRFGPIGARWSAIVPIENELADEWYRASQSDPTLAEIIRDSRPQWSWYVELDATRGAAAKRYFRVFESPGFDRLREYQSDLLADVAAAQRRLVEIGRLVDRIARGLGEARTARGEQALRQTLANSLTEARGGYAMVQYEHDPDDGLHLVREPTSLLDLIYEELVGHIGRRPKAATRRGPGPHFALPECGVCGGLVLATRISANRRESAHRRCRNTAKKRRQRANAIAKRAREVSDGT